MNSRAKLVRLLQEANDSFTSMVAKVDIYGLADNQLPEDGQATITWELVTDAREYGLKSISVLIKQIDVQYENTNLDTQEATAQAFHWRLGEHSWQVDVDSSARSIPFSIYPVSVELYMRERKIIVNF